MKNTLVASLVTVLLGACGSAMPTRPVTPGNLVLSTALPRPSASPFGLSGLSSGPGQARQRAAPTEPFALDEYLKPGDPARKATAIAVDQHAATRPLAPRRANTAAPAPVITAPVLVAALPSAPPSNASNNLAASSDAQRYAQRETTKLERYQAGDVVVIGMSTLLIILLIVLLVLLLR